MDEEIRETRADGMVAKVEAGTISKDRMASRVVAEIEATEETIVVAEDVVMTIEKEMKLMISMIDQSQHRYEEVVAEVEDEVAVEMVVERNDKSMGVTTKTIRENISISMMIIQPRTRLQEIVITTIKNKMSQARTRDTRVEGEEEIQTVIRYKMERMMVANEEDVEMMEVSEEDVEEVVEIKEGIVVVVVEEDIIIKKIKLSKKQETKDKIEEIIYKLYYLTTAH